ncbi:MAG: anhydro-N-acetylmuramic acid kinase [Burkholderiales bacterium]
MSRYLTSDTSLYVGVMSGTSLDGVDAVLADFSPGAPRMLANHYRPYPDDLRASLLALHTPGDNELHRAALLANAVTREYAAAINSLLREHAGSVVGENNHISAAAGGPPQDTYARTIAAIGCHGQTVRHRPEHGYTIQLVNGALLAELTGLTAITDFRSRDIAAGGQGAPLVPAFHAACFRNATTSRVIVNIGGIANVTYLPLRGAISGFDTGPGNLLMDAWVSRRLGENYDRNGAFAAAGKVNTALLQEMLADTYFHQSPPKSTGRDHFNMNWLEAFGINDLPPPDIAATLCELSAASIAGAIDKYCTDAGEIFLCGGGAHNAHLMARLSSHLPNRRLATTEELRMHPDWVEALAFAWLARCAMEKTPGNAPEVTGALGLRVLGAIHPR